MSATELSPTPRPAGRAGLGGLLGALDAALADAELLDGLQEAIESDGDPGVAGLLRTVVEAQGWAGGAWWAVDDGRLRPVAAVGVLGTRPLPRAGVGPLGRSLALGRAVDEAPGPDADCPRARRAHAAGALRCVVLPGASEGREGRLELCGDPPGGVGPERLALLRHVAWLAALVDARQGRRVHVPRR